MLFICSLAYSFQVHEQGTMMTEAGMCVLVWFLCKYEKYLQNNREEHQKLVKSKISSLVPDFAVTEALSFPFCPWLFSVSPAVFCREV